MFFVYNTQTRDFELSFDPIHWLESLIITQMFSDKKCDDPCTGWWAEEIEGFKVGSELYKLKRAKLTSENVELAVQSVYQSIEAIKERAALLDFQIFPEIRRNALTLNVSLAPGSKLQKVDYVFHIEEP